MFGYLFWKIFLNLGDIGRYDIKRPLYNVLITNLLKGECTMLNKKKVLLALVLVLSVFSLLFFSGGGKKAAPPEEKKAVEKKEAPKEITLTIAVLSGVHKNPFIKSGQMFEKEHPGVKIKIVEYPFSDIYDKLMLEATSHSGAIDIFELANGWVPDFAEGGFIVPLDSYFAKKDPGLNDILPAYRGLMKYNGHYYNVTLDGDVFMSYYRKDLLEDPKEKASFKRKYGYDLAIPKTWDNWADIAEFFTRDTNGDGKIDFYGNVLMLSRGHGPFTFMQLLHSYGGTYFDPDTMEPLPNRDADANAYSMLARLTKYGPADMVNWGYTEVRDAFERGDAAMMMQWNEIYWEISETSKIKGKILYGPVPGVMIGGKLNSPAQQAWGWCVSISSDSKNQDMAYEYLWFISKPDISLEVFTIPFNGLDPWRQSDFSKEALEKWVKLSPAAPAWLAGMQQSQKNGVPDLRIPGMFEYYDAVGIQIGQALTGQATPEKAIDAVRTMWNKITERRGLEKQKAAYRENVLELRSE